MYKAMTLQRKLSFCVSWQIAIGQTWTHNMPCMGKEPTAELLKRRNSHKAFLLVGPTWTCQGVSQDQCLTPNSSSPENKVYPHRPTQDLMLLQVLWSPIHILKIMALLVPLNLSVHARPDYWVTSPKSSQSSLPPPTADGQTGWKIWQDGTNAHSTMKGECFVQELGTDLGHYHASDTKLVFTIIHLLLQNLPFHGNCRCVILEFPCCH